MNKDEVTAAAVDYVHALMTPEEALESDRLYALTKDVRGDDLTTAFEVCTAFQDPITNRIRVAKIRLCRAVAQMELDTLTTAS